MNRQLSVPGRYAFAGTTIEILLEEESFSLLHMDNPADVWTPPHLHRREQETVLVLDGALTVEVNGGRETVGAGEWLRLPAGGPHRLGNARTAPARCLVLCSPPGFEQFVREAGHFLPNDGTAPAPSEADIARLAGAAPHYGIVLLDESAVREDEHTGQLPAAGAGRIGEQVVSTLTDTGNATCIFRGRLAAGQTLPFINRDQASAIVVISGVLQLIDDQDERAIVLRAGASMKVEPQTFITLQAAVSGEATYALVGTRDALNDFRSTLS